MGDKYVVTAAHCTAGQSAASLFVRLGDTSLDEEFEAEAFTVGVAAIKQHSQYDSSTLQNDISVLELVEAVSLTDYPNIKPVCLPEAAAQFPGEAVVSGWGTVSYGGHLTSYLNEAGVTVFADGDCGSMNSQMTEDMLCAGLMAGGKDACQGDSGGPLVAADPARNLSMSLVGVVSWGFGCAQPDALGIYAEVSHFTQWLREQMPGLNTCPVFGGSNTTGRVELSPNWSIFFLFNILGIMSASLWLLTIFFLCLPSYRSVAVYTYLFACLLSLFIPIMGIYLTIRLLIDCPFLIRYLLIFILIHLPVTNLPN